MKVEQAKQIASNAIEQLRQALEAGRIERPSKRAKTKQLVATPVAKALESSRRP